MVEVTIDRRSLVVQIADNIREQIFQGKLRTGLVINEAHFAKELNVGRGTIREALRILLAEGILEKETNKSWQVRSLSPDIVVDVLITRGTLEGLAAYMAVQSMTPEREKMLSMLVNDMVVAAKDNDWNKSVTSDFLFHECIIEISGNLIVKQCWLTLASYSKIIMSNFKIPSLSLEENARSHRKLLEVLQSNDPKLAEITFRDAIVSCYTGLSYSETLNSRHNEKHSKTTKEINFLQV